MCMFVAQMEKSSTWSTAISVEGTVWGFGKNSQEVCSSMSVWETAHHLLKHPLQLAMEDTGEGWSDREESQGLLI